MIQPAAISVRTRNTNLIITQLHHAAAVTGGREGPAWLRNSTFSSKIYREF